MFYLLREKEVQNRIRGMKDMPVIGFSTLKDKILDGTKKQTIRPNNPKTNYWLRFRRGDQLFGYWRMRTRHSELLFSSTLSENPFLVTLNEIKTSDVLMRRDGFDSARQAWNEWFKPHYEGRGIASFVVLRWY